jgi:hypothetical protein
MPDGHKKRANRRTTPQKDGSYLIRYRGHRYAIRLRKHLETDTWDVVSIWSEASQSPLPVPPIPRGSRWEALLAGEVSRSVAEALHAAERAIASWLDAAVSEQHRQAG